MISRPWLKRCAACLSIVRCGTTYERVQYDALPSLAGVKLRKRRLLFMKRRWQGESNSMRVLMISKALVAGTSQRKLEELAKCPGVQLTLVTPAYWRSDDGSKQVLERLYTRGYQMIVTPMMLNGNFHLHFYPHLGKIMRDLRPEIVQI